MIKLIQNWKIISALTAMLIAVGVFLYFKGVSDGEKRQAAAQAAVERAAISMQRGITNAIIRLPKGEAQKRLEEKWCRDC